MRTAGNDGFEDRRPAIHNNNNNMVEVRFLRSCVDPNAPQEPLDAAVDADAQAEVDGGELR